MIGPLISFQIVETYPHDISYQTQGLVFHEDQIYESTGSPSFLPDTRSLFGRLCLKTGKIHEYIELDRRIYYGEGSTILRGKIYYLTYKTNVCFVYDLKNLIHLTSFRIPSDEGWGLTNDGSSLIMSDGTNKIKFISSDNFSVRNIIDVRNNSLALSNINDIQYVNGFIFANLYKTNLIAQIDAISGGVEGFVDLTDIVSEVEKLSLNDIGVLNGIAYRASTETFFVTGKFWPLIYELRFFY